MPIMANVFVLFNENKLFSVACQLNCYVHYVGGTLCGFNDEFEAKVFISTLSSLKFNIELYIPFVLNAIR